MSYEKVKSIKVTKDTISFYHGSNNIVPCDWHWSSVPNTEKNMQFLFKDLCGRCLQPMKVCRWWNKLMSEPFMDNIGYFINDDITKPTWWNDWYVKQYGEFDAEKMHRNYELFKVAVKAKFNI